MGNRGEKKKKKGKKLIQKGKKGGREIEKMEDGEKKSRTRETNVTDFPRERYDNLIACKISVRERVARS